LVDIFTNKRLYAKLKALIIVLILLKDKSNRRYLN
jgi:hypothetical protein